MIPSDSEIAIEVAAELFGAQRVSPFRFGIYYDAKKEPARVTVHRVVKNGTMGEVEFTTPASARIWCENALREGYTVDRILGRDYSVSGSVQNRRRYYEQMAKREAMTPQQLRDEDDSIPF